MNIAFKQITYYPKLISKLKNGNYDIVQVHEDSQLMNPLIISALKKSGVKTVLYQGMYQDYLGVYLMYQKAIHFLFLNTLKKKTDVFIAKTKLAGKYLNSKGIQNVTILPVGLDLKKEYGLSIDENILLKFREKFDVLLLYVGVFEKRRDIKLSLCNIRYL